MMRDKAVQESGDHVGSRAFNSDAGTKGYRPSVIPAGLSRSRKDQVQFDSVHNLRKFLKNCCVSEPGGSLKTSLAF